MSSREERQLEHTRPPKLSNGRLGRTLCDFTLVRGERAEDLVLLAARDFEDIEGASKLCRDLVEFGWCDPELPVRLFESVSRLPPVNGRVFERPSRDVADPERSHELETGESREAPGVPFAQLWVLRCLADDRVLNDRIAEVIDDRRYRKDAAEAFVKGLRRA